MKNCEFGLRWTGTVLIFALAPSVALAYIDPGNGAYMVQALFALVGTALFYLRHPIRSLKELWRRFSSRGTETPAARKMNVSSGADPGTARHEGGPDAMSDTVSKAVRDEGMLR